MDFSILQTVMATTSLYLGICRVMISVTSGSKPMAMPLNTSLLNSLSSFDLEAPITSNRKKKL